MAKFSKKQYEDVARVIRESIRSRPVLAVYDGEDEDSPIATLIEGFVSLFARDNRAFDAERFRVACRSYPPYTCDSEFYDRVINDLDKMDLAENRKYSQRWKP